MSLRPAAGAFSALLAFAAVATLASPARAFDQNRKGFVLEFGLGPSAATWIVYENRPYYGATQVGHLHFSGATRFRLGHGVSDRVTLMYVNDLAISLDDVGLYSNSFGMNVLTGAGARWYARPEAPSWHAEGALGLAGIARPGGESPGEKTSGFGFEGGAGYEFARGWSIALEGRHLSFSGQGQIDRNAIDLLVSRIMY